MTAPRVSPERLLRPYDEGTPMEWDADKSTRTDHDAQPLSDAELADCRNEWDRLPKMNTRAYGHYGGVWADWWGGRLLNMLAAARSEARELRETLRIERATGRKCIVLTGGSPGGDLPDCDWPDCGCDPHVERVISGLQECGRVVVPVGERDSMQEIEAERDSLRLRAEKAEADLYTEQMTCAVCGQYGDGCSCGGGAGLRLKLEQAREALKGVLRYRTDVVIGRGDHRRNAAQDCASRAAEMDRSEDGKAWARVDAAIRALAAGEPTP